MAAENNIDNHPISILAVDDEPDLELLVRKYFRPRIKKRELEFSFARDGVEALEQLERNPEIELVLTDLNMPRMDGLTLLAKIAELDRRMRLIVVSAYGDMENIRAAMNLGAFDFVTKPIDFDDLSITIEKTAEILAALKTASEIKDSFDALKRELEIARQIQLSVLPKPDSLAHLPTIDLTADMEPATEVGGDFFDFFQIDEDTIGFALGDVSGKGTGAALFMAITRTALKSTARWVSSVSECMQDVNRQLYPESMSNMFVTLVYGKLSLSTGRLEYCNAGHNLPILVRAGGEISSLEKTNGIGLCLRPEHLYESRTIDLAPGDGVFLYTDGVTEAVSADGSMFGDDRLAKSLESAAGLDSLSIIESVIRDVHVFSEGVDQSDDITTLALRYVGQGPSY